MTNPTPEERAIRIADIRARLEAATVGPWTLDQIPETGECAIFGGPNAWWPLGSALVAANAHYSDAEFIAHARKDIPFLLAALDALSTQPDPEPYVDSEGDRYSTQWGEEPWIMFDPRPGYSQNPADYTPKESK